MFSMNQGGLYFLTMVPRFVKVLHFADYNRPNHESSQEISEICEASLRIVKCLKSECISLLIISWNKITIGNGNKLQNAPQLCLGYSSLTSAIIVSPNVMYMRDFVLWIARVVRLPYRLLSNSRPGWVTA